MPVHTFDFMDDPMVRREDPVWLAEAAAVPQRLKALRRDLPIDSSDAYLDLIVPAFRREPSNLRCYGGFIQTTVDPYGDVFACEPWIRSGPPIGNVLETPLRDLWSSTRYNEVRREIAACRDCYWNCTTELNLLFNGLMPLRRPRSSPHHTFTVRGVGASRRPRRAIG